MIVVDKPLEDAVKAVCEAGRRDAVKALAAETVVAHGDCRVMLEGMALHSRMCGGVPIRVVRVNDTLFLFKAPPEELMAKLKAVPPKKTVPTSKGVLIKMAAARLRKFEEGLKHSDTAQFVSGKGRHSLPEDVCVASLKDLIWKMKGPQHYLLSKAVEDMKAFLDRPDVDDEILRLAADQEKVREIMDL